MKQITILGLGNSRHRQLSSNIEAVIRELDLSVDVEQVMEVEQILSSGVDSIPAVVLNGHVIFDGKTNPTRAELKDALTLNQQEVN